MTPNTPSAVAWRVNSTESGRAHAKVATRRRLGCTPARTMYSTTCLRSPTVNDAPSPQVPNSVTPSHPTRSRWFTCPSILGRSTAPSVSVGTRQAGHRPCKLSAQCVKDQCQCDVRAGMPECAEAGTARKWVQGPGAGRFLGEIATSSHPLTTRSATWQRRGRRQAGRERGTKRRI